MSGAQRLEVDGSTVFIEGTGPGTVVMVHGWPDGVDIGDTASGEFVRLLSIKAKLQIASYQLWLALAYHLPVGLGPTPGRNARVRRAGAESGTPGDAQSTCTIQPTVGCLAGLARGGQQRMQRRSQEPCAGPELRCQNT